MDTVRAELSGMPDDMDENYLVILDRYNEEGIHYERMVTPYTDKKKACATYDALRKNEEPGVVSYLCKLIPLEAIKNEWPDKDSKESDAVLPK